MWGGRWGILRDKAPGLPTLLLTATDGRSEGVAGRNSAGDSVLDAALRSLDADLVAGRGRGAGDDDCAVIGEVGDGKVS